MIYKTKSLKMFLTGLFLFFVVNISFAAEDLEQLKQKQTMPIEEFIELAAANDTIFEKILIDELPLKYRKDLKLPARDLVLAVKADYDLFVNQDREDPEGIVSLTKLFPYSGTDVAVGYESRTSFSSRVNSSEFSTSISQAIAGNAFGRATRLQDKIVGAEIDVAKHQITEAYEDYLAEIILAYYDWYRAYEDLEVGKSSYNENLKLLDNIEQRKQNSIALPIDVNKIKLQVLAKKEKLIELEETYKNALNFIQTAVRFKDGENLVPREPVLYNKIKISFERDFGDFWRNSRTYKILNLLENKTFLEIDKEADDLFPSINLRLGYTLEGDNFEIDNDDGMIFTGISMQWPFPDQVDRAEHKTAKIKLKKAKLNTTNTHYKLFRDIKNLKLKIDKEQHMIETAEEKIKLARAILKDESENYSYGKVTLNDYITAVNVLDNNRFNLILHDIQYKKLIVEWLRITDRLVDKSKINK